MVKWYDNMYIDDEIATDKKRIMCLISKQKRVNDVYCVTIASNPNDMLDIINANELLFSYYTNKVINILALAKSRKSAIDVVSHIVEDVYRSTGDFNVRDYFEQKLIK